MATNKKPRKKYRKKDTFANAIGYVSENLKPLVEFDPEYVTTMKLKDHSALTAVIQGTATRKDMDLISASYNVCYGMWKTLRPPEPANTEFARILYRANLAYRDICERANELKRVVTKSHEMQALNDLISLSDDLLDAVTTKQFGDALRYAKNNAYRTRVVKEGVPA